MSLSWDHRCKKCDKEFSSFSPKATKCYDCTEAVQIKDLHPKEIVKVVPEDGEYKEAKLYADILSSVFGDRWVEVGKYELVLASDEISAFENNRGRRLLWE